MTNSPIYDCLIAGAGPVGLVAANALAQQGISSCLCGLLPHDRPNSPDLRTAALFTGSIRMLERLGIWSGLEQRAAPLAGIRIFDATGHLLRAPEQTFSAAELGLERLGYNIANPDLVRALADRLATSGGIAAHHDLGATIAGYEIASDAVTVTLADGSRRRARLVIAADGRRSAARQAAGITVRTWSREQAALTAHLAHDLPHDDISTEVHTRAGPCTLVPFGPGRSSLVWMMNADDATRRTASNETTFKDELEEILGGIVGPVTLLTPRRAFPLSSLIADRFAAGRVALVGESGHAFPPIGAQGLNLGLRDVATLVDLVTDAVRAGRDPGSKEVLDAYDTGRRADVAARTYGVDVMNASLSGRITSLMRGALLHATAVSPGLRRTLITQGLGPLGPWPSLMRD